MISNKVFILIGVVLAASMVASQNFGENSKCKLNMESAKKEKPMMEACCQIVFQKECVSTKPVMTETEQVQMCECMAKKRGLLSEDEKTYNIEQAKSDLRRFIIVDNETKRKLESVYDDCAAKTQDGKERLTCVRDLTKQICTA